MNVHLVTDISLAVSYVCAAANVFMAFRRNKNFDRLKHLTDSVMKVNHEFSDSLRTIARNNGAVNPQLEAADDWARAYNHLHEFIEDVPTKKETKNESASSDKK